MHAIERESSAPDDFPRNDSADSSTFEIALLHQLAAAASAAVSTTQPWAKKTLAVLVSLSFVMA